MTRFPPVPNVLTSVRMTRTAYAQLLGQKFHPPKVFGQFRERENTKYLLTPVAVPPRNRACVRAYASGGRTDPAARVACLTGLLR